MEAAIARHDSSRKFVGVRFASAATDNEEEPTQRDPGALTKDCQRFRRETQFLGLCAKLNE